MSLYSFYRISKPSEAKVAPERVSGEYKRLRDRTFWGVTGAYALFYVCRMAMSVVKQPLIDGDILSAAQLGLIGSAFYFVYAFGKFANGFIADYCNIRRFMATGLMVSTVVNLVMGVLGLMRGWWGMSSTILFLVFAVVWGINGYCQSMGAPPGVISLSRWFPLNRRGTFYSILSATPYLGKSLSVFFLGLVVGWIGWEYGFIFSAIAGVIGSAVILLLVSDTPESCGLPSVQELSGEEPRKTASMPTRDLQKGVVRHPRIWIIALSSAFNPDHRFLRSVRHSRYSARRMVVGQGIQRQPFRSSTDIGLGLPRIPGRLPPDHRELCPQYSLRCGIQPFDRCGLLHCRRPDGTRHRPEEGYRSRLGNGWIGELRSSRHPECGQRLHDRRQRLRLHSGFRVLAGFMPALVPDTGIILETA